MKKILTVIACSMLAQLAFAQDVIVKINGDELKVKVLEITLHEVVYQSPDSVTGINSSIPKSELFMIRFENGTKEVFETNLAGQSDSVTQHYDPAQMFYRGQQDARLYYTGEGAMWGSAASMVLIGPLGPVVIGAIKPKAHNNPVPSHLFLQDPNYVNGYEKQAHKRKIGKSALGAGIGTAAILALVVIMLASVY